MARQLIYKGIMGRQGVNVDVGGDPKYLEFAPNTPLEVSDAVAKYLLGVAPERFEDVTKEPVAVAAGQSAPAESGKQEGKKHENHRKKRAS